MKVKHCDAFDYWGSGTKVTVSSGIAPSLFPVVQCGHGRGDKLTVGCLVHNFNPMSAITWTDAAGTALPTSVQYPPVTGNNMHVGFSSIEVKQSDWDSWKSFTCAVDNQSIKVENKPSPPKVSLLKEPRGTSQVLFCTAEDFLPKDISVKWTKNGQNVENVTAKAWDPKLNGRTYSTISLLEVSNTDWNSGAVYSCEVSHRQNLYIKKVSKAVVTVNLKQPSPKEIFINKQAKLECVVAGQDREIIQKTQIRWEIVGPNQRNSTTEEIKSEGAIHKKTSTLTQSFSDWLTVEKVRCSAEGEHVSPVTEEIIVQKGDGKDPTVTLHILPDEFIVDKVTLICLVSSSVKQDFYIAWSENVGQNNGVYTDGVTFLPQKHDDHYRVTSLYTTTKKKWESKYTFVCNVWPAGRSDKINPTQVSNAGDFSNMTFSCILEAEDDYSSLWSATSFFIFLFIFSLSYNVIFSLHQHCDYFDYWGKGTEVTVSTVANASPSLFPLTPCDPGSGDTVTLGCLAQDFFPKSATFQWTSTSNSNTQVDSQQFIFPQPNVNKFTGVSVISVPRSKALSYNCSLTHPAGNKNVPVKYAFSPPSVTLLSESDGEKQVLVCSIENFAPKKVSISWKKNNNNVDNVKSFEPMKDGDVYSAASIFKVNKTEWDSKAVYTCDVTHAGQNYIKKASKASLTVTLNPPNPKAMFVNKRAELKCVVTGPDSSIVSKTKIQWYIDEQPVTNNISESNDAQTQTSTLIRHFDDWKKVKTVKCSATREGMAPITESLNVNRGKGTSTVEVLTPSTITGDSVTLVCLVTSTVLQDYYIAWSEASGHDIGTYHDGLNLPPQKINSVYLVSSFYTISKDKWSKNKFSCNVWPAGSDEKMKPHDVSSFSDSNVTIALSCIDNLSEGDDFNGLWSATSSFVFLFIFSLTYNMIFILVQMKK